LRVQTASHPSISILDPCRS